MLRRTSFLKSSSVDSFPGREHLKIDLDELSESVKYSSVNTESGTDSIPVGLVEAERVPLWALCWIVDARR